MRIELKVFNWDVKLSKFIYEHLGESTIQKLTLITNILMCIVILYLILYDRFALILALILWSLSLILQRIFYRPRPYLYLNVDLQTSSPKNHSFPSSHTMVSIGLFLAYHHLTISYLLWVIPFLRVLTLRHWLSDILMTIALCVSFYKFLFLEIK